MARRLTLLLVLLTCAAAATRPRPARPARTSPPPPAYDEDYSADADSADPFVIFDDYDSPERAVTTRPALAARPTPPQRYHTTKSSAKVIIRAKGPKVNATVKNSKHENEKKIVKTTTINIETYTNLIVTEKPQMISAHNYGRPIRYPHRPMVPIAQYEWPEEYMEHDTEISSRRPFAQRKPATTRRPASTTRKPPTSTRRRTPATKPRPKPTTKAPVRTTTKRPAKTTKKPNNNKKTTCPPRNTPWLSSFFQGNKKKKTEKKPSKQGLFSRVYKWIWGPSTGQSSGWFSSSWFQDEEEPKSKPTTTTTSTTTPAPAFATTPNWFQNLLESEEEEAYVANETKKSNNKSAKKNYKGYQLIRAYPDLQWKVHEMLDLEEEAQGSGLMWWTKPSINGSTDMLVPPDLLVDIKDQLKSSKIDFDVVVWDLHKAIMYENPKMSKKQRMELEQVRGHPMTWRRYHRYSDMLRYLEYLQISYSEFVELVPLGRSSEGLPLVAVKIAMPSNETKPMSTNKSKDSYKKKWKLKSKMKPAVWIDGGAHAREWIAPAVATWILHALVEGEKGMQAEHEMLRQADFYIMPVLNPDGYEHSHTHDRLWRKTRSRHTDPSDDYTSWLPWNWGGTECVGVDPDRNWDYHWGEHGASRDPCSEKYAGPHPFSESETRAVSAFLAEHRDQIKVYISLHAYSQLWMMPSSHAHAPFSDDGVLMEMGKLATAALADLYGTKYQVGTAAELQQPASGMSHDWAKARAGVKFSYHVDLRDSFGPYGFLLPGSQIVSTAKETWQAVKAIVDNLG